MNFEEHKHSIYSIIRYLHTKTYCHEQFVTKMINTSPFLKSTNTYINDVIFYSFIFNELEDVLFLLFFLSS